MTSTDVEELTAALLRLWGCPPPPAALWTPSGARRLLREWPQTRPGSVRELKLVLGVVDPAVRVETEQVRRGSLLVRITWRRWQTATELSAIAPQAGELVAATEAVLAWWKPLGLTLASEILWPGGSLVVSPAPMGKVPMSHNDHLLEQFAGRFLGVRHGQPVPARTWVALGASGLLEKRPREVVLGDVRLERFLFNVRPWKATVRVMEEVIAPGQTELHLAALREVSRLELIGPAGLDRADFRLNGRAAVPESWPERPEHYVFFLPEVVRPGDAVHFSCTPAPAAGRAEDPASPADTQDAEGVRFRVNPALFEACRYHTSDREYRRDFRPGGDVGGSYPNIVAGGGGLTTAEQPYPLDEGTAQESDDSLFARARHVMLGRHLARRHDVVALVAGRFPGIEHVECSEVVWEERDAAGWVREVPGVRVTVRSACRPGEATARLRARLERFLSHHLPAGVTSRVEVIPGGEQ
jgi:hypothetical protein